MWTGVVLLHFDLEHKLSNFQRQVLPNSRMYRKKRQLGQDL